MHNKGISQSSKRHIHHELTLHSEVVLLFISAIQDWFFKFNLYTIDPLRRRDTQLYRFYSF